MKRPAKKTKCLTCKNKPVSRGLCATCLAAAKARIHRGEATEQELIELKLILPAKRMGRPANSGFAKAFERRK